jgi:hypothetical protein
LWPGGRHLHALRDLLQARYDARIFTDDAEQLSVALSRRHENATALSPEQITVYSISM